VCERDARSLLRQRLGSNRCNCRKEDQPLPKQNLEVAEFLEQKIKELNRVIRQSQSEEEKLLEKTPEIGPWVPWA
jgi:hypothetical protein